jgi:hypothetical protein
MDFKRGTSKNFTEYLNATLCDLKDAKTNQDIECILRANFRDLVANKASVFAMRNPDFENIIKELYDALILEEK